MLERLYGSLMRGPLLNCSPHRRRQRIDLTALRRLDDGPQEQILRSLLSSGGKAKVKANVPVPPQDVLEKEKERQAEAVKRILRTGSEQANTEEPSEPRDPRIEHWDAQQKLLLRLRHLGEDALSYAQETGVEALEIGYPLLSLPPGAVSSGKRRILAPVALIGCSMTVRSSGRAGVELECRASDIERVVPNPALFAWLSRELGTKPPEDLFADEAGEEPWREIAELTKLVTEWLDLEGDFEAWTDPDRFEIQATPRTPKLPVQRALLASAVLGLFPTSNQGLLRDTHALLERGVPEGPIQSFLSAGKALDLEVEPKLDTGSGTERDLAGDRLVLAADPMQSQAVRLARHHRGLVVHGPPGTGKSQTIANIIGDHLCRGERVLFVCDKRTAIDVVANRLEALELDELSAVVHDPQRDRRDLFMKIRGRLERLTELFSDPDADSALERIDSRIREVHGRLEAVRQSLHGNRGAPSGPSFHRLLGRWLELLNRLGRRLESPLEGVGVEQLEAQRAVLERIFNRGVDVGYGSQPWIKGAGGDLESFLALSVQEIETRLSKLLDAAEALDAEPATLESSDFQEGPLVAIEPFGDGALQQQVEHRERLADRLEDTSRIGLETCRFGAGLDAQEVAAWRQRLDESAEDRAKLSSEPLDAELVRRMGGQAPTPLDLAQQILKLKHFLESHKSWWGFVRLRERKEGRETMGAYGLEGSPDLAPRLLTFLEGLELRDRLAQLLALRGPNFVIETGPQDPGDSTLRAALAELEAVVQVREAGLLADVDDGTREALRADPPTDVFVQSLRRSRTRADKIADFEKSAAASELLTPDFESDLGRRARQGERLTTTAEGLYAHRRHLEDVHRLRRDLDQVTPALRQGCEELLARDESFETAHAVLEHRVTENVARFMLADDPLLAELDERAVEADFEALRHLLEQKRDLVLNRIAGRWAEIQKQRLVAATGTKLNGLGAAVRQRLYVRGKRSMKLRQVMRVGRAMEYNDGGDDPLFDLCPVWMCSPETVAQIFPLQPIFDIVIFDEASQCRLEEALPVLVRARRVVIAGDMHQLPPTRFFESTVASSEMQEIESEDDLFEAQQTEMEDLLGSALQLDVQESYLDVHYRSRHETLIEFSNQHFYGNRLQALPGHPEDLIELAPISFRQLSGLYENRSNRAEAEAVVELIDELLQREHPPSLGVATFNLVQKDLVSDLLAEKAETDPDFRRRYEEARNLKRDGAFEGLFVKNLENVQGDERDHVIISTTYGRNAEGKFYRRFGPLGSRGGGRRLNVLVTRARHHLHILTSIPSEVYRKHQAMPLEGRPSGSWLLLAYLRYAEDASHWERYLDGAGADRDKIRKDAREQAEQTRVEGLDVSSPLVDSLATRLGCFQGEQMVTSGRYWGNEGFCVDLTARIDRGRRQGLLLDFARYRRAPDVVEWDLFANGLLRSHGWNLRRHFSPGLFRDPDKAIDELIGRAIEEASAKGED